jgi:hypothetical protein
MGSSRQFLLFCLTIAGLLCARPGTCQETPKPPQEGFWDSDERTQAAVAVQMIAQADPYMSALVRIQAKRINIWHEPKYDVSRGAPELDAQRLLLIKDRTTLPDFRGRAPHERGKIELATYDLYWQALLFSYDAPLEAFEKSAEKNDGVTLANLYRSKDESSPYRGQVIPIEGRLRRLRRTEAPVPLLDRRGLKYVYEGWIEGPTKKAPLFWVVVPWQPEDKDDPTGLLKPAEEMDRPVKFYGYFFKVITYPAQIGSGDQLKNVNLFAPLLIGPTILVTAPAVPPPPTETIAGPFSSLLLTVLAGFGSFALLVIVGLSWWFHRGDRQFRARLHRFHADRALEGLQNTTGHEEMETEKRHPPVDLEET